MKKVKKEVRIYLLCVAEESELRK